LKKNLHVGDFYFNGWLNTLFGINNLKKKKNGNKNQVIEWVGKVGNKEPF
jgi:hypothetical protein